MPDGKFSSPIFTPYVLYGQIDYIYGWPAYNARNGFTAAQASLNALETVGYIGYLWVVWSKGKGKDKALPGGWGGLAVLFGFALSVMTVSKTLLYGKWYIVFLPSATEKWVFLGIRDPQESHTNIPPLPNASPLREAGQSWGYQSSHISYVMHLFLKAWASYFMPRRSPSDVLAPRRILTSGR